MLSIAPSDMHLWIEAYKALRRKSPQEIEDIMAKDESASNTNSKNDNETMDVFCTCH